LEAFAPTDFHVARAAYRQESRLTDYMKDLLFLAHRIPYPPNKGDKIRSFNWLKHLAQDWRVHLGTFVDDGDDLRHVAAVQEMCAQTYVRRLRPGVARVRSLTGLVTGKPLTLPYYHDRGMAAWVGDTLTRRRIDAVLVFSAAMAQYLPRDGAGRLRTVCDFVDVDSDKWRQYAGTLSRPMCWLYHREARRLLTFERRVAWRTDASVFVSDAEAALFRRCAPEVAERVVAVHNGVDTEYFSPRREYPNPYRTDELPIVFVGAMDYRPNVDAVTWFAERVLPGVRRSVSGARFFVVGTRPVEAVRRLAEDPAIRVTGAVEDIRPYLAHARLAVAPLRIARGVQNKVLEAMAMARTIVVSAQGLDGIHAEPHREVLLAEGEHAFARQVLKVLEGDVCDIGSAARRRVVKDYAWDRNLRCMQDLLEGESLALQAAGPAHGEALAVAP
jgi:sugar transferase (PEP-CTERM/EpsH1 system associated)